MSGLALIAGRIGQGRASSSKICRVEADLRELASSICLALPEATASDHHPPHRSFLVGKKNFAWFVVDEHGDGRIGLVVRAAPGANQALVASDSDRFGMPKYVARHGWVTYFLDLPDRPVDWEEVTELVTDSYLLQAPKRLARLVNTSPEDDV